jgi:hypothetical protein
LILGLAYERCSRFNEAIIHYEQATGSSSAVSSSSITTPIRALSAAAHVGLGWSKLYRHHHTAPQQQQQNVAEKTFQIAHAHFLTALKLISSSSSSSADATRSDDAMALQLRIYRGLVISLCDQR